MMKSVLSRISDIRPAELTGSNQRKLSAEILDVLNW